MHTHSILLLEEQTLWTFHAGWLEILGNLICYRMAVATMVMGSQAHVPEELTATAVSAVLLLDSPLVRQSYPLLLITCQICS